MKNLVLDQLTLLKDLAIDGIILLATLGFTSLGQAHFEHGRLTCGTANQEQQAAQEIPNPQ